MAYWTTVSQWVYAHTSTAESLFVHRSPICQPPITPTTAQTRVACASTAPLNTTSLFSITMTVHVRQRRGASSLLYSLFVRLTPVSDERTPKDPRPADRRATLLETRLRASSGRMRHRRIQAPLSFVLRAHRPQRTKSAGACGSGQMLNRVRARTMPTPTIVSPVPTMWRARKQRFPGSASRYCASSFPWNRTST